MTLRFVKRTFVVHPSTNFFCCDGHVRDNEYRSARTLEKGDVIIQLWNEIHKHEDGEDVDLTRVLTRHGLMWMRTWMLLKRHETG